MAEESEPTQTQHVFSANPGDRIMSLLGTLACVAVGVFFVWTGLYWKAYSAAIFGLCSLGVAYSMAWRLRERFGQIVICEDCIEKTGAGFTDRITFDGTESVVPIQGGYALRQGTARIPVYRRHPQIDCIENLLCDRSRVFHETWLPVLPFTLFVASPDGSNFLFSWLIISLFFGNLSELLIGKGTSYTNVALALSLLSGGILIALKFAGGTKLRFEPDRIVIKTRSRERSIGAPDVRFNMPSDSAMMLHAEGGKPGIFISRDYVAIPLGTLKRFIERAYLQRDSQSRGNVR